MLQLDTPPKTAFEEVSMDRTREVHVHINWTVDARTQNCDETFTLTAHGEGTFSVTQT
jgi:hypothetical protein